VPEHLKYSDGRRAVVETLVELRDVLVDELANAGHSVAFNQKSGHLTIDRSVTASVAVARCLMQQDRFPRWSVARKVDRSLDLIVIARMDDANESILDYLVMPPARLQGIAIPIGMHNPANVNAKFIGTLDEVIEKIEKFKQYKDRRGRQPRKERRSQGEALIPSDRPR
jgi:hypothetical protein